MSMPCWTPSELRGRAGTIARALLPRPLHARAAQSGPALTLAHRRAADAIGVRVPSFRGIPGRARPRRRCAGRSPTCPWARSPQRRRVPEELSLRLRGRLDAGELPGRLRLCHRPHRRGADRPPEGAVSAADALERPAPRAGRSGAVLVDHGDGDCAGDAKQLRTAGLSTSTPRSPTARRELDARANQIELIASENFTCRPVFEAIGSTPTNSTPRAIPQALYGGCEVVTRSSSSPSTVRRRSSARSTRTSSPMRARRRTWPSTGRTEAGRERSCRSIPRPLVHLIPRSQGNSQFSPPPCTLSSNTASCARRTSSTTTKFAAGEGAPPTADRC